MKPILSIFLCNIRVWIFQLHNGLISASSRNLARLQICLCNLLKEGNSGGGFAASRCSWECAIDLMRAIFLPKDSFWLCNSHLLIVPQSDGVKFFSSPLVHPGGLGLISAGKNLPLRFVYDSVLLRRNIDMQRRCHCDRIRVNWS